MIELAQLPGDELTWGAVIGFVARQLIDWYSTYRHKRKARRR